MSAHTPGPWKLETQRAPNGGTYYRIYDHEDANAVISQVIGDGRIEYHANARLIAAAPELLEALKVAQAIINKDIDITEMDCEQIAQAIRLAEGRP